MPTAAKLAAAVAFALVAVITAQLYIPYLPEGTQLGWFRPITGIIGFVGLLVPHLVRRLTYGHRALLAGSFLAGGVLLVLSDLLARTLFSPNEISIGAVTALLGAPAFLVLLRRRA